MKGASAMVSSVKGSKGKFSTSVITDCTERGAGFSGTEIIDFFVKDDLTRKRNEITMILLGLYVSIPTTYSSLPLMTDCKATL